MNKKIKILIAAGGTGGHVLPGLNLAKHFLELDYFVSIVSDKRGTRFLEQLKELRTIILPSSPLVKKNVYLIFFSSIFIIYSIIRSLFFLLLNRPKILIGMGGYASLPICIAAIILRIKFVIYENNLIVGKANKFLAHFAEKILVSNKDVEGIPIKYNIKILEIGNIIKKEFINFSKNSINTEDKKINILVLGGSQAAKTFADILPKLFKECSQLGIYLKIYQHCLPDQSKNLKEFYSKENIEFETFNFTKNLEKYLSKVSLAITRSGSSVLAELTNANIPFISVPLPSSADNHQLKNAIFYERKNFAFLIEENDLNDKLVNLIQEIHNDRSKLNKIIENQKEYSDKNVYDNINKIIKELINEKN